MQAFIFGIILLLFLSPPADALAAPAALFLNPASGSFLVGSTFDLSIVLDTKGTAVNTVEVELGFPPDKLQVASPSVGPSIIQLWPAPPVFSNQEGRIYFVGGIPSPGIVTSQGIVLTLSFRVIAPGEGQIRFGQRVSVLANDGRGTDILDQRTPAFFKFLLPPSQGPAVFSPTHPDQERFYRDPNPIFVWSKGQFAAGYSFTLDQDSAGFPDTTVEGEEATASFKNLESGIWYFHLRELAGESWSGVSHYAVKIDGDPPAAFKLQISPKARTTNRRPILRFFTTDGLSGLDHFEMKIVPLTRAEGEAGLFFEVSSPYQPAELLPGRYQAVVRAVDRAGNFRDEAAMIQILGLTGRVFSPEGITTPVGFISWPKAILGASGLLTGLLLALFFLWLRHKHHRQQALQPPGQPSGAAPASPPGS